MLKSFQKLILDNNIRDYQSFEKNLKSIPDLKLKGDHFECLVYYILQLHPFYGHKQVFFQKDIPPSLNEKYQLPETDKGFDLLSIDHDDQVYGIQAKFRKNINTVIPFGDLSTTPGLAFITNINNVIFFTNCLDICKELKNNTKIVNVCGVFWDSIDQEQIFEKIRSTFQNQPFILKKKTPRDYQSAIIQNTKNHYTQFNTGINHMACGTGKTLAAYWIAQEYQMVVVCVPSLILLSQFFREWFKESTTQSLLVGSDFQSDENTGMLLTTNSEKITEWLTKLGKKWIFTTYQSNHLVKEALFKQGLTADMIIYDEAHKLVNSEWSNSLNIPTHKKHFMTATLKYYQGSNDDVIDMQSEIFGKVINTINLRQAINLKCVSDYRLMTLISSNDFFKRMDCILEKEKSYPKWLIGSVILLVKTLEKYAEIKKIISYHNSCEEAKQFQRLLEHRKIQSFYIDGSLTMNKRLKLIKEFKECERAVICSARVLQEGIDLPFVDTCMFVSPKNSVIDIIQSACRCMRLYADKKIATLIVCTPVESDETSNTEVCLNSAFQPLWNIVRALSSCDSDIKAYFKDPVANTCNFEFLTEGDEIVKNYIDVSTFGAQIGIKMWNKLIDTTDRFNNWYEAVKISDNLVAQTYCYNGFKTGVFQSDMISAYAGNNLYYKKNLDEWSQMIDKLPKIRAELDKRINSSREAHLKVVVTSDDRFNIWIEAITLNNCLVKSNFIYIDINIGSFQTSLINSLANNGKKIYKIDNINKWQEKIKELDPIIQAELAKKIIECEQSKNEPEFSSQDRFDAWYQAVQTNGGLIDAKLVDGQMNIGTFQTNLLGTLSGRAIKYQEYLDQWNVEIDKLPEIVVKNIRDKVEASKTRCAGETVTSNERFEIWFNEVVKNQGLLPYAHKFNGLNIGEFQTNLLGVLNGTKQNYKTEINDWKIKINTFDQKIITEINERKAESNKRRKPLSPEEYFNLWLIEVTKNKTLVAPTYKKDEARIGFFQGQLIKNIAGLEKCYQKTLAKWTIEIDKLPEIKAELDKCVELIKINKQTLKDVSIDERFNAWYSAVKDTKNLVTSNYVYNDINVGSFQYCLIKSFAEKKTYKDSRDRWEKEIKLLDEAIQKKLDDKIKKFKANPSFSSQERFETWYQEVKKLNSLVSYNYVAGNKIQIGVFQDCLIRSLSNRSNNYKEYLPQWQEKINLLSDTIRNDINIRIEVSKPKAVKIV